MKKALQSHRLYNFLFFVSIVLILSLHACGESSMEDVSYSIESKKEYLDDVPPTMIGAEDKIP
ncbi:MAG: hypothetical protein JKY48_08220 [Flavobacteriales bacterium]|nr:hypothetical protein [Flavobacteriales bacterium]